MENTAQTSVSNGNAQKAEPSAAGSTPGDRIPGKSGETLFTQDQPQKEIMPGTGIKKEEEKISASDTSCLSPFSITLPAAFHASPAADTIELKINIPTTELKKILPPVEEAHSPRTEKTEDHSEAAAASIPVYPSVLIPPPRKMKEYAPEEILVFLRNEKMKFALGYDSSTSRKLFPCEPPDGDVWFLSDIHGDMLAFRKIVNYIDCVSKDPVLVFLGDIFDRGPEGIQAVCALLGLIHDRPGRVIWLQGNHDVGLKYEEENKKFSGAVEPAEFTDYLNANLETMTSFGKELIDFISRLPVALLFKDGLLAVHGGVPFNDRVQSPLDSVKSLADLEAPELVTRFIWARFCAKQNSRYNKKDSDFGIANFVGFCERIASVSEVKLSRIICGHQHFAGGFRTYPENESVQGECIYSSYKTDLPEDISSLAIARYRKDLAPELHVLQETRGIVSEYFNLAEAESEDE